MGRRGEDLAVEFLMRHGLTVVARNVPVAGGEIDIVARDGSQRVAVEVRTSRGRDDPVDAIGPAKRRRVRYLASVLGVGRVDYIGVRPARFSCDIHWVVDGF